MPGAGNPRHQARRLALLGAYSLGEGLVGDLGLGVESALAADGGSGLVAEHSSELLGTIVSSFNARREDAMARLDGLMDFPLEEVALVDRIVLVLAMLELLDCPETPKAVVINEWVNLCKEYGSDKGYRMVNAVLDSAPAVH